MFSIFFWIFDIGSDGHKSPYPDVREVFYLFQKGDHLLQHQAELTLLPGNIDLQKDVCGQISLCRLLFDLFCQMQAVHGMDQNCLSHHLLHLVGL